MRTIRGTRPVVSSFTAALCLHSSNQTETTFLRIQESGPLINSFKMTNWQVFSAVALRRLPELMPRKDPIELKVQELYSAYEIAKSKFSKHEIEHLNDLKAKESDSIEVIIKETAQDKEDRWNKEKSLFKFGTYDDRLTYTQYLFINQKFGSDLKDQWLLPQAPYDREQDANLLDTARRALKESLNIMNGFHIVSKIPSSVYSFRYPKKIVEATGFKGAKVFFLKAHLDTPSQEVLEAVDDKKNGDRLRWLTRKEAVESVHKHYLVSLSQGLLHEKRVDTNRIFAWANSYLDSIHNKAQNQRQAS